jgi:hypothetical protein
MRATFDRAPTHHRGSPGHTFLFLFRYLGNAFEKLVYEVLGWRRLICRHFGAAASVDICLEIACIMLRCGNILVIGEINSQPVRAR